MTTTAHSATGGVPPDGSPVVAAWLWLTAALVFAMIVVGGATRLTDSGLSITEWQPILGAIPPLSDADWQVAFEKYKQIPEYDIVNKGMSLEAFKGIYWWEWGHRFLGRIIGVVFGVPLVIFWMTGRLRRGTGSKYFGLFALGALQGAIGWYMVSSGLADRVDVSQYRLALHLTTAFAILGLLVWLALDESGAERSVLPTVRGGALVLIALVVGQVVLGAFVAGLKAGLVYNTWPDMNGRFFPSDYWIEPAWLSFFESHAAAQFNHRVVAYVLVIAALWQAFRVVRQGHSGAVRTSAIVLAVAVLAQMTLGIATLLSGVPLGLGLIHQGGGALVMGIAVWHFYAAGSHRMPTPATRS